MAFTAMATAAAPHGTRRLMPLSTVGAPPLPPPPPSLQPLAAPLPPPRDWKMFWRSRRPQLSSAAKKLPRARFVTRPLTAGYGESVSLAKARTLDCLAGQAGVVAGGRGANPRRPTCRTLAHRCRGQVSRARVLLIHDHQRRCVVKASLELMEFHQPVASLACV